MAKGGPLDDAERQAIIADLRAGGSVNGVAKAHDRSPSTVSKIGRQAGIDSLSGAHSRLARAHEARRAYGAEARAERLAKIHERIDRILERMGQRHTAFNFGGKDNTLATLELDEPDSDALRQYASAVAQLSRAEMEIVKHDERGDGDHADVDSWLRDMFGGQ